MTALDGGVIALLLLIAAGGYHQGFVRGLTRTAALAGIGLLTATLSLGLRLSGDVESVVLRVAALFLGALLVVGALVWMLNRLAPAAVHQSQLNKALGVLPALLQGLIVIALVLGFVHRVALEQEMQRYIARGVVTGPLIEPVAWLERALAGLP